MKKIVNKNFRKYVLTLFLAMCGTIIPVFSQIRYTAAVLDEATYGISNMSPCAIRHWRGTFSVAAANLGGGSVAFCLIDHTDFDNTFATLLRCQPYMGLLCTFQIRSIIQTL